MEKRVKSLYIITIIAILAFLGMQGYWLYRRYEFALQDYERKLAERVVRCVDVYNEIRDKSSSRNQDSTLRDDSRIELPSISITHKYGDTVKTTRTARIFTYRASAYDLLGIRPGTPLTEEMKKRAIDLAQQNMKVPVDSGVYDASGAKDENEAWTASNNVQTERRCPFTVNGVDSVLKKAGIKARVSLFRSDSTVWQSKIKFHDSALSPRLSVTMPYSQMEGRCVTIVSPIQPFDVLSGMWQTLILTFIISTLLIVCLMLQISTVLRLSRIDRMKNSFVTTMIHELKRPLSTLKMCVSGLDNERMMAEEDTKREMLSETRKALDNLSAYFAKLRDITFNDVEQIPLNISSVNLHDLFDNAVAGISSPAWKSVILRNDIDKDIEVSADRSHLHNIMTNLVENAIKYSGSSVEIKAIATCGNGTVELHVSDTGNGISSVDLGHIFNRFYRGKASAGEQPGMGLGLAYVKLLVKAHGGEISVRSREGKGSCFTIRLPQ